MSFCKWFYETYKEGIKIVSQFLIGCLGIYILFLMLTPFLPLFSNVPWTSYEEWLHLTLYVMVCLFSILGVIFYFIIVGLYTNYMKDAKGKEITFKVKPQWIAYTVAIIMIFTYIGYNGGYENGGFDGHASGFRIGAEYIRSLSSVVDYPASMSLSLESGIFDFSSNVTVDGSVHTETSITDIIIIKNTDDERIARFPTIMLYNPVVEKHGIPDTLKQISITIDGAEVCYSSNIIGLMIDDLYPEKQTSLTINITFTISDVGSFQDGETYICYIFFYQTYADYVDRVPFTIIT